MSDQKDMFGYAPAQGSLFGEGEGRMQPPKVSARPHPDVIRKRAHDLLAQMRAASAMPWTRKEAEMWQTVFPNMTTWLPEEEGGQLRLEFKRELERLSKAA